METILLQDTVAFVIDGLMIFTALLVMLGLAKRRPALVLPALILMVSYLVLVVLSNIFRVVLYIFIIISHLQFIPAFGLGMLLGWAIYLAFYGCK